MGQCWTTEQDTAGHSICQSIWQCFIFYFGSIRGMLSYSLPRRQFTYQQVAYIFKLSFTGKFKLSIKTSTKTKDNYKTTPTPPHFNFFSFQLRNITFCSLSVQISFLEVMPEKMMKFTNLTKKKKNFKIYI